LEDDILKYGKENMYLKAEKCLDDVLKHIEEDNLRKEKEKQLKEKEKLEREIREYFKQNIAISNKVHSPRFGYDLSSGKDELDNLYKKMCDMK